MHRPALTAILCALALPASGIARASEAEEYPVREIERPGSLPWGLWRLDAALVLLHEEGSFGTGSTAGVGIGLGRSFEAGARVLDLELSPRTGLRAPLLYLTWAAQLTPRIGFEPAIAFVLPVGQAASFDVTAEAKYRLNDRLEPSLMATYIAALQSELDTSLALSVALKLQFAERVFASPAVGVILERRGESFQTEHARDWFAFDAVAALLGFEIGWSMGGRSGPLLDLVLRWQWPSLIALTGPQSLGPGHWLWIFDARLTLGRD